MGAFGAEFAEIVWPTFIASSRAALPDFRPGTHQAGVL
jgi:hypothetical protein